VGNNTVRRLPGFGLRFLPISATKSTQTVIPKSCGVKSFLAVVLEIVCLRAHPRQVPLTVVASGGSFDLVVGLERRDLAGVGIPVTLLLCHLTGLEGIYTAG
jgi:hypothetical protein